VFLGLHEQQIVLCVEGALFAPGERAFPNVEKVSAARATRYDEISLCMGQQSKTCETFDLDEYKFHSLEIKFSHGNFSAD
jgi:hypothetical protein